MNKQQNSARHSLVISFNNLLDNARELINDISKDKKIELNGEDFAFKLIDPLSDNDLADVVSIENGNILLDNGTEANVKDFTNLTDLVGLLETIGGEYE